MSVPTPNLERRVRQLDNDVQAIYEMLVGIETTQRRQANQLTTIDTRLEGIDGRLDGHDTRFDGVDAKLDEILRRLPSS